MSSSASAISQTLLRTPATSTTLTPSASVRDFVLPGSGVTRATVAHPGAAQPMMPENELAGLRMPSDPELLSHGRRTSLARAYPAPARWVAGSLVALSRASLPAIAVAVWLRLSEPYSLATLIAMLAAYAALPAAAAWLLERAFTASVEVRERALHIRGRDLRFEVPCASIARVEPWRVPLPGFGFWLRLGSGSRLRPGLEAPDLEPLLGALAEAGGVDSAREALRHPFVVYAAAKARWPRRLLSHPLFKFAGFSLLPTAVMFNAHQHIAYGGTLGQYYLGRPRRLAADVRRLLGVRLHLSRLVRERVSNARGGRRTPRGARRVGARREGASGRRDRLRGALLRRRPRARNGPFPALTFSATASAD